MKSGFFSDDLNSDVWKPSQVEEIIFPLLMTTTYITTDLKKQKPMGFKEFDELIDSDDAPSAPINKISRHSLELLTA